MKKLGIILLSIAFLLSAFSFLPVKRASANTGPERCMLMAAEPWHWWYHSGKGGSGSSGGDNQGISDSTNYSVTKHFPISSAQRPSYQKGHRNPIKQRNQSLNWWTRFYLFWQMIFNR